MKSYSNSIQEKAPSLSDGFALVSALALMAFLLLLLLSLATLVAIEGRRTGVELDQFMARQNALLGVRLAVAELQAQVGIDQRVTATAAIVSGSTDGDGEPMAAATGKTYWTGVWNVDDLLTTPGGGEPEEGEVDARVATVNWLVSGGMAGADFAAAIDDESGMATLWRNGDESVQAPLVNLPEGTDALSQGAFAFWVGDEGTKAKVNLINPWQGDPTDEPQSRYAFLAAQRFGIENVADLGELASLYGFESAEESINLQRVLTTAQLASLDGSINSQRLQTERFHDITAYSFGVLADTRNGGLRVDLTRAFSSDQVNGDAEIFSDGPRWGLLHRFYNLATETSGLVPEVRPRVSDGTTRWRDEAIQIAPIIVASGLSFGLRAEPFGGPQSDGEEEFIEAWDNFVAEMITHYDELDNINHPDIPTYAEYQNQYFGQYHILVPYLQPWIILANPYDVRLAETDYRLRTQTGNWTAAGMNDRPPGEKNPRVRLRRPAMLYDNASDTEPTFFSIYPPAGRNPPQDLIRVNQMLPHEDGDPDWEQGVTSYRLSFSTAFEPGELKVFYPVENTNTAISHVVELEEVDIESIDPFALNRWVRGRLQPHLKLNMGYREERRTNPPPPLPTEVDWQIFLDQRTALVRSSLISEDFQVAGLSSHPPQYNHLLYLRNPDDEDEGPIETAKYNAYVISPGSFGQYGDAIVSLESGALEPTLNTAIRLKSTEYPRQALRPFISGNIRSRSFVYASYGDVEDHVAARMAWGGVKTPFYDWLEDGGTNPVYDDSELWEPYATSNNRMVLFHIPREQLFSIGDFQHLDISNSSFSPTYAVGNSHASPWVPADASRTPWEMQNSQVQTWFHDTSWELNDALWDRYFFSTWPLVESEHGEVPVTPPVGGYPANKRLIPLQDNERMEALGYNEIAGQLIVDGPFNVNSTSVEAWKAVLSGMNQQRLQYHDVLTGEPIESPSLSNPLMRSPYPGGDASDFWRGYRELDSSQLQALAEAIVVEVKRKGPFPSLATFINRDLGSESDPDSLMGPLQRAIVNSGINDTSGHGRPVQDDPNMHVKFREAALGNTAVGAPGYITQADILRVLGPILSTRSDTFIIRAYGESRADGLRQSPARAWCEAVAQRMPEWVNDQIEPHDPASGDAELFGRRFRVISLRWIAEEDI